MKIFFE